MDGIIIINKERGFTSHDVVAKLRGILRQKKIGHTGTLDPDAEGVLPVCLGKATKVCEYLADTDKTYEAGLLLGVETDTQDMTGTILRECGEIPDEETVRAAVHSFEGSYDQVPPMYSALKVNGRKLYELARAGREVERKPRHVEILSIEILNCSLPHLFLRVRCTKGTYIRTLCADIGGKLGCGGAMESLVRTRAAGFSLEQAVTLAEVEKYRDDGSLQGRVIPLESVFAGLPKLTVNENGRKPLANGNPLRPEWGILEAGEEDPPSRAAVYDPERGFAALYGWSAGRNCWMPEKMF